jgi:hypothetical protein
MYSYIQCSGLETPRLMAMGTQRPFIRRPAAVAQTVELASALKAKDIFLYVQCCPKKRIRVDETRNDVWP